jgi:hypothetical protein
MNFGDLTPCLTYACNQAAQSHRNGKRGPCAIINTCAIVLRQRMEMGQSNPYQTFRGGNGIVLFAGYRLFKTGLKKAYIPMCQKETIEPVYHE